MPYQVVYEWIEMFKSGGTRVMDKGLSEQTSMLTADKRQEESMAFIVIARGVTMESTRQDLNYLFSA